MTRSSLVSNIFNPARLVGILILAAVVLVACAPAATVAPTEAPTAVLPAAVPTNPPAPTATTALSIPATGIQTEATINLMTDAKYGKILVDGNGMTLYMYTKDAPDKVNCAGGCLKAWPPLLTQGSPKLGDGVDPKLIGTADVGDGTKIVTYNHMPLYYWAKDKMAGDMTGLGVGGVWYLVSDTGKIVGQEATINIVTDPKYGKVLVDGKGMTLYIYTNDEPDKVNCAGGCLKAWPPLLTSGSPKLGDGVNSTLIGSATLPDGSMVVTYNHMPLYYFAKDVKAGDMAGVGIGGVWYLVGPDGKLVGKTSGSGY